MANVDVGGFLGTNFDGDKAIEKILEAENKKKEPILNKRFNSQMQKESWVALRSKLSDLNTASRNLYSPLYSPFRKTLSKSSDDGLITIDNSKSDPSKTKPGDYKLIPKQMAKVDHFRSDDLKENYKVGKTSFNVVHKGKEYNINFNGGSIEDLASLLKEKIGDFAEVKVNEISSGKKVLSIKGKNIGKKEKIHFTGDLTELNKMGLLTRSKEKLKDLLLTQEKGLTGSKDLTLLLTSKGVHLEPQDLVNKVLDESEVVEKGSSLVLHITATKADPKARKPKSIVQLDQDPEKEIQGFIDKLWVGDASLFGDPLISLLPKTAQEKKQDLLKKQDPNKENALKNTLKVKINLGSSTITREIAYKASNEKQEVVVPLEKGVIESVEILNNGELAVQISKMELSVNGDGAMVPKNPISKAQNAIVNYEGIDYERESNTIDDVVPGVTFTINGESKNPVKLNVDWNYDEIMKSLNHFIVAYNNSMDFFRKLTEMDEELMQDRTYRPSYNEMLALKKAAYEKLTEQEKKDGAFDGTLYKGYLISDSSVKTIRSKMQRLTVAPYKTDALKKLMFLSQLGIRRPGMRDINTSSKEDQDNFHAGYLEFTKNDQEKFLSFLKGNYMAVQQLFFQKSSPDRILYDKGLAVEMNSLLDKIVANNFRGDDKRVYPGLIQVKVNSLEQEKGRYDRQVSDFDKRLKREETRLKRQFSAVYRAQSQAKANQAQLEKLSK